MRTTIDLPDYLFRKLKAVASMKGISLKKIITRAIEHEIEAQSIRFEEPNEVSFPLVASPNPGSLKIDSGVVARALDEEDRDVSS
jgi:hypothetical protein